MKLLLIDHQKQNPYKLFLRGAFVTSDIFESEFHSFLLFQYKGTTKCTFRTTEWSCLSSFDTSRVVLRHRRKSESHFRGTVDDELWNNKLRNFGEEVGFRTETPNCDTEPYHLLSPNTAWGEEGGSHGRHSNIPAVPALSSLLVRFFISFSAASTGNLGLAFYHYLPRRTAYNEAVFLWVCSETILALSACSKYWALVPSAFHLAYAS